MDAKVIYSARCSACDTPLPNLDVRECHGCNSIFIRSTIILRNPFRKRKMKEKSTQKQIKKLKDQLNRSRGNGRMVFELSQRIETLENTK